VRAGAPVVQPGRDSGQGDLEVGPVGVPDPNFLSASKDRAKPSRVLDELLGVNEGGARSNPHFRARPSVTNPTVIRLPRSPAFRATPYHGQFQASASSNVFSAIVSIRSVPPGPQKFT
jgi:hypothetical protein